MNLGAWRQRWEEGRTPFHRDGVNPHLRAFAERAFGAEPCRVFVPLCGKSHDVPWLIGQGHDVVAVEVSSLALEQLCQEHGIEARRSDEGPLRLYRGERLRAYEGDFFDLAPDRVPAVDAIWDRAALIALAEGDRVRYVERLLQFLAPHGSVLLAGLDYEPGGMQGPPYSVSRAEVERLFAGCAVDCLVQEDILDQEPRFRERGLQWLQESVYLIRRRR